MNDSKYLKISVVKTKSWYSVIIPGYVSIVQLHTFYWYHTHTHTKYASWYDEFPNDIITISPFPVFHEKIKMRRQW